MLFLDLSNTLNDKITKVKIYYLFFNKDFETSILYFYSKNPKTKQQTSSIF